MVWFRAYLVRHIRFGIPHHFLQKRLSDRKVLSSCCDPHGFSHGRDRSHRTHSGTCLDGQQSAGTYVDASPHPNNRNLLFCCFYEVGISDFRQEICKCGYVNQQRPENGADSAS